MLCPKCRVPLQYDEKTGELYCPRCGEVFEEVRYEQKEWRILESSHFYTKPRAHKYVPYSITTFEVDFREVDDVKYWKNLQKTMYQLLVPDSYTLRQYLYEIWSAWDTPLKQILSEDEVLDFALSVIQKVQIQKREKIIPTLTFNGKNLKLPTVSLPSAVRTLVSPAVLYACTYKLYIDKIEYIPLWIFYQRFIIKDKTISLLKEFREYYDKVLLPTTRYLFPQLILKTYLFSQISWVLRRENIIKAWESFALAIAYLYSNRLLYVLDRYSPYVFLSYIYVRDGPDEAKKVLNLLKNYFYLTTNCWNVVKKYSTGESEYSPIKVVKIVSKMDLPPLYKRYIDALKRVLGINE